MTPDISAHLTQIEAEARRHSHPHAPLTLCSVTPGYIDRVRLLASYGRFRITSDEGWRLHCVWPALDPLAAQVEADARSYTATHEPLAFCYATDLYIERLRVLALLGRFRITSDEGWRLRGYWPALGPLASPAAPTATANPTSPTAALCPGH